YPAVLQQVIADEFPGLDPRDLGLRLGLFGGEAGLDNPDLRRRLTALACAMGARDPVTLGDGLLLLLEGAYVMAQLLGADGPSPSVA
ncbi:hypothetical protein ACE4Z5_26885, partial [Salmonella enterica]|uniref:hypothetical protein n=1 Tax=Salmonella enterica TaxID=28901 RepID=UPI003D26E875